MRAAAISLVVFVVSVSPVGAQTGFLDFLDHVHLVAFEQTQSVDWYRKHFGGEPMTEGTDRLMFGATRLLFRRDAEGLPSQGAAIDHIAFSVADLDATLLAVEADGADVVTQVEDLLGLYRVAAIDDPWGVRLVIVEDPDTLGLHHVHLRADDPAATLAWYSNHFGGTASRLRGQIDGINFAGVWLLVQRGTSELSADLSGDHIGFRPIDIDGAVAQLRRRGVTVTDGPREFILPSGVSMRVAFVEGPDGGRIELVQRAED